MTNRQKILADIEAERQRQLLKWGDQHHTPAWWFVILGEEVGEVARAIFESDWTKGATNYRDELVQVAAVAVAALEDYDIHYGTDRPQPL